MNGRDWWERERGVSAWGSRVKIKIQILVHEYQYHWLPWWKEANDKSAKHITRASFAHCFKLFTNRYFLHQTNELCSKKICNTRQDHTLFTTKLHTLKSHEEKILLFCIYGLQGCPKILLLTAGGRSTRCKKISLKLITCRNQGFIYRGREEEASPPKSSPSPWKIMYPHEFIYLNSQKNLMKRNNRKYLHI